LKIINVITDEDKGLLSEMLIVAKKIATDLKINLDIQGYKLIFNVGRGVGKRLITFTYTY
jgi:diadenosine tetraphosphate (Ap4A) HIT family hydrolase